MKSFLLFVSLISFQAEATWILPSEIKVNQTSFSSQQTLNNSVQLNVKVAQGGVSESDFKSVIKKIQTTYGPIVKNLGGRLAISGNWKSKSIFAGATQMFGSWKVKITGGLARQPLLTADGMTLILCHELGHHIGGFAFASPQSPLSGSWASNEGQSDYFSTHVCARNIWKNELEKNAEYRVLSSPEVRKRCDSVWKDSNQKDLCYRTLVAVDSMISTMAYLKGESKPNFETPISTSVASTDHSHPNTQCRMDTAVQGSLCDATFNQNIIPGKKFPRRFENSDAEKEAAMNSCTRLSGFSIGLRPTCWFKGQF